MKFYKLIVVLFFPITIIGFGQNSDLGLFLGTSYYLGELNPSTPISNKVNPSLGVFYRKNISKRYALRFGVNYLKLAAADKNRSTELSQFRQLSFTANLWEAYGVLEFNFIPYQINNYTTSPFSPYVFIGLAGFLVSPNVDGPITDIVKEDVVAPSIPFGLGVKFDFSGNLGLAIEWGMRKTFTDQIEGLPETYVHGYQLSNSQNNDWYSTVGLTLNYKFLTKSDYCRGPVN